MAGYQGTDAEDGTLPVAVSAVDEALFASDPEYRGRDGENTGEGDGGFLVSGGDGPPLLQAGPWPLDDVAADGDPAWADEKTRGRSCAWPGMKATERPQKPPRERPRERTATGTAERLAAVPLFQRLRPPSHRSDAWRLLGPVLPGVAVRSEPEGPTHNPAHDPSPNTVRHNPDRRASPGSGFTRDARRIPDTALVSGTPGNPTQAKPWPERRPRSIAV